MRVRFFSLKETVILYDLTNTYFEGSKRGSKVAKHGLSKERRNDCPLITLSDNVQDIVHKNNGHDIVQ